ncbi:hypothetical protein UPYG_G00192560 [Umbra pygmaea]|uniref:Peptidase S1 domain-containing protein n=1 Tax=Umbra pygmaea TaxID=75934 RepID=A0ABD0X4E9_UMBPY
MDLPAWPHFNVFTCKLLYKTKDKLLDEKDKHLLTMGKQILLFVLWSMMGTLTSAVSVCGNAPLDPRIVGGKDVLPGSWPWYASIQQDGVHMCGGSLISRHWVLSAAHCFSSPNEWNVTLGLESLQEFNPTTESRTVAEVMIHPDYDIITNDNDIALVRLSSPVNFTDYIQPICLAANDSEFHSGDRMWAVCWGDAGGEWNTSTPHSNLTDPQLLQEVSLLVVGNRECECLYGNGSITDNMLCAGVLDGGQASCQGDSGGAMVVNQNSSWMQSGIGSFGARCAEMNLPVVYTRVSQYQSWINSQTSTDPPGFVEFTPTMDDNDSFFICPDPPTTTVQMTTFDVGSIFGHGQSLFGSLYTVTALFFLLFLTM